MPNTERRRPAPPTQTTEQLRRDLSPAQLRALQTLEAFKWELKFVRRPLFLEPVPVMVDREGLKYAIIRPDGSVDEAPKLKLRR